MSTELMKTDSQVDTGDKNAKRAKAISTVITALPFLIGLYFILPYAITLVKNAADLVAMAIRLGLLTASAWVLWMLFQGFKGSIGHWIEKMSYRALDSVIADRPTESMRIEIAKAERDKKEYTSGLGEMIQVVKDMRKRETTQAAAAMEMLDAASHFKKVGDFSNETLSRNNATRKKESNDRMKPVIEGYEVHVNKMKKLSDALEFFIQDRKNLCEQLESDWTYSRTMRKAMGKAQKNLQMMEDDSIFRRAARIAEDDIKKNMAYVESAMQDSKSIMDAADLQKGIMDQKSQGLLQRFETGEFDEVISMMNRSSSLEDLKIRAQQSKTDSNSEEPKKLSAKKFEELY